MLIFQSLTLVLIMDLKRNFIDAVIAWVDGSESKLNKKRNQYLNLSLKQQIPGAANTRFRSLYEIRYCVLSILKFAPFIRKIFIVTDKQDPKMRRICAMLVHWFSWLRLYACSVRERANGLPFGCRP